MLLSRTKLLQNTSLMDMRALVLKFVNSSVHHRRYAVISQVGILCAIQQILLTAGTAMHRGQGGSALPRQDLHQDASRHRYRFAPPATPNGFWDMGFGDSQDSRS